jgi:signal transduction histidine kinase
MARPLAALLVEDVERDAMLLVRELQRGGFEPTWERVESSAAMAEALSRRRWDVVLSDYSLPSFSGPAALALVKERALDLPFVIVSGTVGEEVAVAAMRAGAHDFLAKGRLARLAPVIERELGEAALRAERRAMQDQLIISERMASLGTLAAGVAHEINNPLAVVLANLDFALEGLVDPDRVEALREARDAAERVRLIVRDLKILSRPTEENRGPVDVRRVLDATIRMAHNEIRHRAELVRVDGEVPLVDASEARLGQVFLNLIINAAQAIPVGSARSHTIRVVTSTDARGNVVIDVSDTGGGIEEAHRAHVFEPFFTTKPVGVGTGLGLSICHRIVTSLGGTLSFESVKGEGTTFRTTLPAAREDAAPATRSSAPPEVARCSRGKVLVVDDEPVLGRLVSRMIQSEHDVTVVARAREALTTMERETFDVVLCDLMMPEMTGMDLVEHLRARSPALADRVVLMTGGAFTERAREFLAAVPNQRLEKPFDAATLSALVRGFVR